MPDNFMISPAGFILDYAVATPPTVGVGLKPNFVWQPLPGMVTFMNSTGDVPLNATVSGTQGTLQAICTAGTAGAAQVVAFLVDNITTPTLFLGISLDTTNRPCAWILDAHGTTVAHFANSGSAVVSGTPMTINLAWNSAAAVQSTHFAELKVNGAIPTGTWSTDATTAWTPFQPTALLVGDQGKSTFQSLGAFVGTVQKVQVTNTVVA